MGEGALDLAQQAGGEFLAQRAAFGLQHGGDKVPDGLVEGRAELRGGELASQIFGGEESLTHGAADGLGQAGLVFWDGAVKLQAPRSCGSVRMKQHPDRDGVGQSAGECAEHDRHGGGD